MIKEFWNDRIKLDWRLGVGLIIIFSFSRFFAVMYGIRTGDNKYLSIIFASMIVLPFLLLDKDGRSFAKIKKPKGLVSLFKSFLIGGIVCYLIYLLGQIIYGDNSLNWFKYIGESYPINFETITANDKKIYFIVFLMIGMTFSPFGEELLYRGVIHSSFVKKLGENNSAIIDSMAFGFAHLAHYGLIYQENTWTFKFVPALLWISLMVMVGLVLNYCRRISNSIWGAIIAHMAFNITMIYLIFYKLFG